MDNLNFEEELVEYAEVSGFDVTSGRYMKDFSLLKEDIEDVKKSIKFLSSFKAFFFKSANAL